MNPDVYQANNYNRVVTSETSKDLGLKPGETYKINIVATVTSGTDLGTIFPYKQFEINVPDPTGLNSTLP